MADVYVNCVTLEGAEEDRMIAELGGPQPNGEPELWIHTTEEMINLILAKKHNFWTSVDGESIWLEVKEHPTSGRFYITTEGDSFPPHKLMGLPLCPPEAG
jgi:hypothetical protein